MDPIPAFTDLLEQARASESADATACALATVDASGAPSVRIVLLKGVNDSGFTFFTNLGSRKAAELTANPRAALCFYWPSLNTQVRVEGTAVPVTREESQAYFATRPRESQLGAWASQQSAPLGSREELMRHFHEMEARFEGAPVTLPPHWGGFCLTPHRIELWRAGDFRLHDRQVFTRTEQGWASQRLYP